MENSKDEKDISMSTNLNKSNDHFLNTNKSNNEKNLIDKIVEIVLKKLGTMKKKKEMMKKIEKDEKKKNKKKENNKIKKKFKELEKIYDEVKGKMNSLEKLCFYQKMKIEESIEKNKKLENDLENILEKEKKMEKKISQLDFLKPNFEIEILEKEKLYFKSQRRILTNYEKDGISNKEIFKVKCQKKDNVFYTKSVIMDNNYDFVNNGKKNLENIQNFICDDNKYNLIECDISKNVNKINDKDLEKNIHNFEMEKNEAHDTFKNIQDKNNLTQKEKKKKIIEKKEKSLNKKKDNKKKNNDNNLKELKIEEEILNTEAHLKIESEEDIDEDSITLNFEKKLDISTISELQSPLKKDSLNKSFELKKEELNDHDKKKIKLENDKNLKNENESKNDIKKLKNEKELKNEEELNIEKKIINEKVLKDQKLLQNNQDSQKNLQNEILLKKKEKLIKSDRLIKEELIKQKEKEKKEEKLKKKVIQSFHKKKKENKKKYSSNRLSLNKPGKNSYGRLFEKKRTKLKKLKKNSIINENEELEKNKEDLRKIKIYPKVEKSKSINLSKKKNSMENLEIRKNKLKSQDKIHNKNFKINLKKDKDKKNTLFKKNKNNFILENPEKINKINIFKGKKLPEVYESFEEKNFEAIYTNENIFNKKQDFVYKNYNTYNPENFEMFYKNNYNNNQNNFSLNKKNFLEQYKKKNFNNSIDQNFNINLKNYNNSFDQNFNNKNLNEKFSNHFMSVKEPNHNPLNEAYLGIQSEEFVTDYNIITPKVIKPKINIHLLENLEDKIKNGIDFNKLDDYYHTYLYYAIIEENFFAIKLLKLNKAKLNNNEYNKSMKTAIYNNDLNSVKILVFLGEKDKKFDNITPLKYCCKLDKEEIALFLLKKEVNIKHSFGHIRNLLTNDYNENIMVAIVNKMIEQNYIINHPYSYSKKNTPLHLAVIISKPRLVNIFIKKKFNLDAKNSQNKTPLFIAIENGDYNLVQILINAGASVNTFHEIRISSKCQFLTPLNICVKLNLINIFKFLVDNGGVINLVHRKYHSPLFDSVIFGRIEILHILIYNNIDLSLVWEKGNALIHASKNNSSINKFEIIKILILNNCDLNFKYCEKSSKPKLFTDFLDKKILDQLKNENLIF